MKINLSHLFKIGFTTLMLVVLVFSTALAAVVTGTDVKVTHDNNNIDGGTPDPGFDAQNRQQNETTTAISPVNPAVVAIADNDYRMVTVTGDVWLGFAVSNDSGANWFNTFVPGFPSDTTAEGMSSPLYGLDASGDPVVRFDADGNLYISAIAFNRNFDQPDRPVDNLVYVAKYDYTPGTPGETSTPNSAGDPPDFTYAGTAVVQRGAVGYAVPSAGFAGIFTDKEWMETDNYAASPCYGNVYVAFTAFHAGGSSPIKISTSSDGGLSFGKPRQVSTGGKAGTPYNQGADIAVAPNGDIYLAYTTFEASPLVKSTVSIVKSSDCGFKWSQPIEVGITTEVQAPGVAFRTPTFAFVSADDTDPNIVYVTYQSFDTINNDYDIFAQKSTDGGQTWGAAVQVNEDPGSHNQIFPTIDVSGGVYHAAWYDFRNSASGANDLLDVYYTYSSDGLASFAPDERVTDIPHNANCLLFGGGTAAFHGDYIELDAVFSGGVHTVQVSWADNRDVNPCDLDPSPGPLSDNTGNRNANIYTDRLLVTP